MLVVKCYRTAIYLREQNGLRSITVDVGSELHASKDFFLYLASSKLLVFVVSSVGRCCLPIKIYMYEHGRQTGLWFSVTDEVRCSNLDCSA